MNFIKAALFGLVEGITEWLPVSSTAHMKILNAFISLNVSQAFYNVFEVVIQLGAIIALVVVIFNDLWPFFKTGERFGKGILAIFEKEKFFLWLKITIACLPVILYKLFVEDYVTFVNADNEMTFIGCSLIGVGILFIIVELALSKRKPSVNSTSQITYLMALVIGLAQLVAAIFPGVSRSGATIIAGMLLGLTRPTAMLFTFELAFPVMVGASLMEVLEFGFSYSLTEALILAIGCFVAFAVSQVTIRAILNYIKEHDFKLLGVYRVLIGIIVLLLLK